MPLHPASETEAQVDDPDAVRKLGLRGPGDSGGPSHVFRQYRAPAQHGQAFIEPPLADAAGLIGRNRDVAIAYPSLISDLRRRARRELIDSGCEYTGAYRDVSWVNRGETTPIIMAGHQPALFHPGVWFKNFALSHLAAETDALAVNLVIDNDVASGSSIRVPSIDPDNDQVRYVSIPYDNAGGGVPYEQTTIRDRICFDQFDQRVRSAIAPIVADPCIGRLWKHAVAAVSRCGVAGCALAQSRHALEEEIGLKTLEVPLGVLCRSTAFAEFVLTILSELPRFLKCYNGAADDYRQVHGIRSTAHPVPNLSEDGKWIEAPLWIYGDDAPARRAAWVQLSNDHLVISDRGGGSRSSEQVRRGDSSSRTAKEIRIDIRHPKLAVQQLASAANAYFKLRPRALLTTMYARLVLSDLFLHGIGGAKYDQLGDLIIRSFFGVEPPQFMVISATVQLPNIDQDDHAKEIRRLLRQLRDLRFQPERFADQVDMDANLLRQKRDLLAHQPPQGERKAWHDSLDRINRSLSESLQELRYQYVQRLAEVQRQASASAVLSSREHPFCLYPLTYLTGTFQALLD